MPDIIPNVVIGMPSQLFTMPRKFGAVFGGRIYIGKIDTDPTIPSNQIQVYLENEDGSLVPMAQPLLINAGGFPVYNGQIAKFVTVQGHSMAVYDALNVQQFYFPSVLKYDPDQFEQRLSEPTGAGLIGVQPQGTVQSKLDEIDNSIAGLELSYQLRNSRYLGIANKKIKAGEAITIVCVGDSITAGYDVNSPDKIPATNGDWATHAPIQYPMQVETQLNFFTSSTATVINRGYSGDTAKSCFNRWTTNPNSSVAHIMLGINDSLGSNGATFEEYCEYMELLIRRYIDWGCGVVLHTATAIRFNNGNEPSGYFTEFIRSIAKSYNCPIFESEGVHQYRIGTSFQSDGTHFNKTGYALYGDAVTAFILSGGWRGNNRLINSLTSIQAGRSTEGIGFFSKGASLATDANNGYLTNGSTGRIPANASGVISFHFFMDCDVANLSVIGNITDCFVRMSNVYGGGDSASNRLTTKALQNRRLFETTGVKIQPGRSGAARNTMVGTYVGRGWKTLYVQFDGSQTVDRYTQGIIIEPVKPSEATQLNFGDFRKGNDEVMIMQLPGYSYLASASAPPPAVNISGDKFLPLPDGLYPFVGAAGSFFDSAPAYVTIETFGSSDNANHPNGITQFILRRGGTGTVLIVEKTYSTGTNSIIPSAAGIGSSVYAVDEQSPVSVNKTTDPTSTLQGWLWMTFPTTAYTAYYRIEVRCASKGGQSSWLA